MKTILIGAGRIGSVVAFYLSRAGHDVTVVARGTRLNALQRDGAIVTTAGERASVQVVPELDPLTPCDLVIVTVPEYQVGPLLPLLSQCRAKTVLLMFNTFEGCARYRSVIGPERFAFGFPNMTAALVEQRLRFRVDGPGMVTTLSRPELVTLFNDAGLPGEYERDMDGFLRSHVALAVPLFIAALLMWDRDYHLTWQEARRLDDAWTDGFDLVRSMGHPLKPTIVAILSRMPSSLRALALWAFSRSRLVKDVGEFGPRETRFLIDAMVAVSPERTRHLRALRP